jgi:hypothetical protein
MLRPSICPLKIGKRAIPPNRGDAHPRLGACMVPIYIIYLITMDSVPGGHDLAP